MSQLRSIVERSYEAYNARDFRAYGELLDEHVEFMQSGITVRGRAAVTDLMAVAARARPGLRIELQRVVAERGDTIVTAIRAIDRTPDAADGDVDTVQSEARVVHRVASGRIVALRTYVDPVGDARGATTVAVIAEQAALGRVAKLVAGRPPPEEVFALVTEELSLLLDVELVRMVRFEPDGSVTVLASRGMAPDRLAPGTNVPLPSGTVIDQVFRTGRPARVEGYAQVAGPVGEILRREGARSGAGGPIVVDGRLWGAMAVGSTARTLAPGTEDQVAQFAELVSTAISNIESQAEVERLAAEQSALRRVAELVARQAPAEHIFAAVTEELSHVLGVDMVRMARFEPDGGATVLATTAPSVLIPPGTKIPIPQGTAIGEVFRTGGPARVEDYAQVPGAIGDTIRAEGARCGAAGPIVVDGRLWGALSIGSSTVETLPLGAEERIAQFAELVSTAISNLESHGKVEELAAEQSALRRVAELVARQAPSEQVFDLVTEELNQLLDVNLVRTVRFEPDRSATVLATRGVSQRGLGPGTNVPTLRGTVIEQVLRTGRPARVEDYAQLPGLIGEAVREGGLRSAAGGPIVVDGSVWGAMAVGSTARTLPPGTEDRVAQFAELVSTAVSNIESRGKVERLAAEQSALRRVAELVAREHSPDDLFATLVEEVRVLLGVDASEILRYEADATATMVAGWTDAAIPLPVGERLPLEGQNLAAEVKRNGVAERMEDYSDARGPIAAMSREVGIRSAVASPIVVEGAIWGMIAVATRGSEPLPPDTEARLQEFSRVAGLAVANAKSRSDLAESRARIVRAGDEARRRFERDLHDGAQQRLVSLGLELGTAEASLPADAGDVRGILSRLGAGVREALDDLRELSRGLHPAVLSDDGLRPALESLKLRSAVPVDLRIDLDADRFDELVEVAAYYVASEALTNTAKHAHASTAEVTVQERDGWLELVIRDDGRGGADPSSGSGLTGLADRVEALGGAMEVESPPDGGTAINVRLPAPRRSGNRVATISR